MSTVIINEFELTPAPQPAQPGPDGNAQGAPAESAPAASLVQEVERLLRRQIKRSLRTWAH
jgi:hypothetical protein